MNNFLGIFGRFLSENYFEVLRRDRANQTSTERSELRHHIYSAEERTSFEKVIEQAQMICENMVDRRRCLRVERGQKEATDDDVILHPASFLYFRFDAKRL